MIKKVKQHPSKPLVEEEAVDLHVLKSRGMM
jgi:hypothetical protein